MDNTSNEKFIITQAKIGANKQEIKSNRQESDEKMTNLTEEIKPMLASSTTPITNNINTLKSFQTKKDSPNITDPTTVVLANRKAPPLDGGKSTKIVGIWNLKHNIISPKSYELLIKKELKQDTYLELNNFYNHIKMYLNAVTRLQWYLLSSYQSIKRHSEFE